MAVSSENQGSKRVENLPISGTPGFNGDHLAMIFGTYLSDPVFVLDCESGQIVAGNQEFLRVVGMDPAQPTVFGFDWERIVHPEDRSVFNTWIGAAGDGFTTDFQESFELRFLDAGAQELPVNIVLKYIRWKQREYLIGFVRDISAQQKREGRFRQQIQEQKARAIEAIKSSLCVYQLTEKIKSTPVLTTRLLNVENEEELFHEAAQVLTSEEGLNYRDVAFLVLDSNVLQVAYSTRELDRDRYPLSESHPFSEFIRSNFNLPDSDDGSIFVPLKSRGQLMGICEVTPYSREKFFFDESGKVGEWQKDVLLTIGDIIALLIDNLRLTREIKRRSIMDTLTETYNRYYFVGRLSAEIQRAGRYGRPISMLFLDVDRFKEVNDSYGHLFGDQVLRDLGKLFVQSLRKTDVVCRYGGDEFVALLPETGDEMAFETAEKLLHAVREHRIPHPDDPDETLSISVSIGVHTLQPGESEDDFLKGADDALYRAKEAGRNRLVRRL